jgi:vancomycin resistance protein VanJ
MMRLASLGCRLLAVAYPIALAVVIGCLRLIGERWWGTAVGLYLPRWLFALPLVPLTAAVFWLGPRRLLWTQVAAAVLLWFPLLGFHLSWPPAAQPGGLRLRLVSCNVDTGAFGNDAILAMLQAARADIIVLQAVHPNQYAALRAGMPGFVIREAGQFWIASRFPVDGALEPPKIARRGIARSPRFARFTVETPRGPVVLYDVHPISPRDGLEEIRGEGIRYEIMSGQLFNSNARATVAANTQLRLSQVRAIAEDARQSPYPVIIAGDTNLPGLSWAFANLLGEYREGFAAAGSGFGYTFPAPRHPWMRIDRIIADQHWRFLDFRVIHAAVSDHYAVLADLELPAAVRSADPNAPPLPRTPPPQSAAECSDRTSGCGS